MKTTIGLWALAGALTAGSLAMAAPGTIEKVKISVTRKTGERRTSSPQGGARRVAQSKDTETYFVIQLQRMTPDTPEEVKVEYLAVIEGALGNLHPDLRGEETVKLPLGRAVELETESITLKTVSWNGGPRGGPGGGAAGESVYGYIVRVRSADGTLLAEKIQPRDLERKADAMFQEADKQEQRKDRAGNLGLPAPGGPLIPGVPRL